jgi:hypothetical protein
MEMNLPRNNSSGQTKQLRDGGLILACLLCSMRKRVDLAANRRFNSYRDFFHRINLSPDGRRPVALGIFGGT